MHKSFVLVLAGVCGAASAQMPATNPMPDGSRDMFAGLGLVSAARYEGAQERKVRALPVLQVQWSNGVFVSGTSAGIHLSQQPSIEFGPLLAWQPRRSAKGSDGDAGGIGDSTLVTIAPISKLAPIVHIDRLAGMEPVPARLQYGGFLNYYLTPQWRATGSVLWGAGARRNGGKFELGVQRVATRIAAHHTLSLSAAVTFANRTYNQAYFGVSEDEAIYSVNPAYHPGEGLKDAYFGARWNWALSPSWLVTTSLKATRLLGAAKDSPLVERPTNLTVSTAVAYRF